MVKRALLIGCNYPGTKAELHGCVNDVSRMYKCLVDRFGFSEEDITVMVDTDKRSVQPTGANIKKVLGDLIDDSSPGDVLVMHYSGHGTQVPDETGDPSDKDGLDEAIVPTDLNIMTDDDFRPFFLRIQRGVQFTFVADSCHSGGLIDHEKEQIGDGIGETRGLTPSVPAQSRAYGGGTRSYGGGNEQQSEYESRGERHGHQEYGRREEPQERYGYGRREDPEYGQEEGYGRYGRREEPQYGREEGHGRHGRREEQEYGRGEGYGRHGRREEQGYGGGEGYGGRQGRMEEQPSYYEDEPRRETYGVQQGYGQEYGQHRPERRDEGVAYGRVPSKTKSLSMETLSSMLSDRVGHQVQPGNIRTSLYDIFGEDASPTVKVFVNLIANRLSGDNSEGQGSGGGGVWGTIGGLAMDFLKTKLSDNGSDYTGPAQAHAMSSAAPQSRYDERVADDIGILVSGCQSNETSADANPTGNPKQAYGALSNAIQTILAETNGPITNGQLVREVRGMLRKQGFAQHPCLYCSDQNVNSTFICE